MKRIIFYPLALFITMFLFESNTFGQNAEETSDIKLIGLGIQVEQIKFIDWSMNPALGPANKIILTITPNNSFRLEPKVGFNYHKDKENDTDLISRGIHLGIGTYGMYQVNKTNIYAGLKYEYGNLSVDYIKYWSVAIKEQEITKRHLVGPVIGAEFFLGEHFSIGGEVGLLYMRLKSENRRYGPKDDELSYITTDTGFILRFYF